MLPTHENIKQDNNNRSVGEKGEGDEVLELLMESYSMTQFRWLGTRGPQALRGGNPLPSFHESIKSPGYRV